jgi:hypothetical protein
MHSKQLAERCQSEHQDVNMQIIGRQNTVAKMAQVGAFA